MKQERESFVDDSRWIMLEETRVFVYDGIDVEFEKFGEESGLRVNFLAIAGD